MIDRNRRQFFKRGLLKQLAGIVAGFQDGMATADRKDSFERFFESDESCYALTLAYPDDLLLETAKLSGIETEGRDKKRYRQGAFLEEGWG
jgi:biotin-(acetyl-CoA carboxylase) ligase